MGNALARVLVLTAASLVLACGMAAAEDAGLDIFIKQGCHTCHTIAARDADVEKAKAAFEKEKGVQTGKETRIRGGDLSSIGKKRPADWLEKFLKDPKPKFKDDADCQLKAVEKDRKKFKGSDEELNALLSFLVTQKRLVPQRPFTSCLKE